MRAAMFWLTVVAAVLLMAMLVSGLIRDNGFSTITADPWWGIPVLVGFFGVLPTVIAGAPWLLDRRNRTDAADWVAIPAGIALTAYGIVTVIAGGGMFVFTGVPLALTRLLPDE